MSFKRPVEYVNTFIGTHGAGHALVGPQVPRGMVKLGPDTLTLPNAGYDYCDMNMLGFVHLHQEGAGGHGGRGNILVAPVNGELFTDERKYYSPYSHDNEEAFVGYYRVWLERYRVNAELAATARCGIHRYTYTTPGVNRVLFDLGHTLGGYNKCGGGRIRILSPGSLEGEGLYFTADMEFKKAYKAYFYAELSRPADSFGVWKNGEILENRSFAECDPSENRRSRLGAFLNFETSAPETLLVKVGVSYVSCAQAKANLEAEVPGWDFDGAVTACKNAWNEYLSRIGVSGGDEKEKVKFYSALYRAANSPVDINEHGVYATGASGEQETMVSPRGFYCEDWALWDTARTTHPLAALIEPERCPDMCETFIDIYRRGGWLPMATAPANGVPEVMIGHNAVPVMLDAYVHGYTDFDIETAYEAMKKSATQFNPERYGLGTPEDYIKDGYYHFDAPQPGGRNFACSRTLEVCWADWCTAQTAKLLGKTEDYEYFIKRARNYEKLFDPETRFMRPRNGDGSFFEKFNPADSFKNGFCECTSWEYTFFVPHDIQGLINLIGGREEFVARLDEFFERRFFNYQNETSIQVPFLYCYAGAPYKTQKLVLECLKKNYWDTVNGLHGEDDAGAMSSWYVLAACGLYPVCPGDGTYVITTPMFKNLSFRTANGVFRIVCDDYDGNRIYIGSALLNGKPLNRPWLTWDEVNSGGELRLKMTDNPYNGWGVLPECAPPSMTKKPVSAEIVSLDVPSECGGEFTARVTLKNSGARGSVKVAVWDGDIPLGHGFLMLGEGEQGTIDLKLPLFAPGKRLITVKGEAIKNEKAAAVRMTKVNLPSVHVLGRISLSTPFSVFGSGETISVRFRAKNTGGATFSGELSIYVNGKAAGTVGASLRAGEESAFEAPLLLSKAGSYKIRVEDSPEEVFEIVSAPSSAWIQANSTKAEIYTGEESVYIRAEGEQNKNEFGMLFRAEPVTGDFDAYAKVSYEELTCPYAPAMIIVKNDPSPDNFEGMVSGGAMSKRGFHFDYADGELLAPYRYAPGCPEVPYYFKLTKRGRDFMNYYSFDNENWTLHCGVRVETAADTQYIGLLNNAACPVARLVKFDYLRIEKR